MSDADDLRFEKKLPLDYGDLLEFRAWHRASGRDFVPAYEDRIVNNIYFDAPDLRSYAENLDGVSSRAKVRLRWYGETLEPAECRFEVKLKRNQASHKLVEHVAGPLGLPGALDSLPHALRRAVRSDLWLYLDATPQPTLFNRYRREYYATRDGIRLTVDTDMTYLQLLTDRIDPTRMRPSPVHAVVELKFAVADKRLAESYFDSIPHRISKHSKYVQGLGTALF